MNLYADTSALIKKYIQEAGSEKTNAYFDLFPFIGTAALTHAEVASAMSKAVRLGWVDEASATTAWQVFLTHWQGYIRLPVTSAVIAQAASLSWRRGLRAYDAVHLACALTWKGISGDEVVFACFDQSLLKAADEEGLKVWPEADQAD